MIPPFADHRGSWFRCDLLIRDREKRSASPIYPQSRPPEYRLLESMGKKPETMQNADEDQPLAADPHPSYETYP